MYDLNTLNYQTVFEYSFEPLGVLAVSTESLELNRSARELFQIKEDAISISFSSLFPAHELTDIAESEICALKTVIDSDSATITTRVQRIDDTLYLLAFEDPAKKEKYFHAQRLETLGMLSGGIAHDFNNVLTGLLGHITYLKTILPQTGPHTESLAAIEEGSKKASVMTQEILNFSRLRTIEQTESVDLRELLQKTCGLLRGAFPPTCRLSFNSPQKALYVDGVEGKLAQVFVNLVMNSKAALNDSGDIRIVLLENSRVLDSGSTQQIAIVRIEDAGEGISEEVLTRVFEPFFSTKKHGTGLGLATVKRIVDECGGEITIESAVGKGTVVSVILPLVTTDTSVRVHEPQCALQNGSERILIVDDEDPVRNVICVSLKHLGYSVAVARSGNEAIETVKTDPDGFDLVILDMLMPEMSGDETFFLLKELNPNIRALVISGYSSEASVQKVLQNGGRGFIQKPFSIEQLSAKVRECLIDE